MDQAEQLQLDVFEQELDDLLADAPSTTRGQEILKRGLSYLHEALADWLFINPGGTLREMGAHFGYSQSWLCQVINTDMFKAYVASRREQISAQIAESLPKKLEAAAHLATERVIEVIEKSQDSETLLNAFDKVMHRYGYAPKPTGGNGAPLVQNNVFYLTRDELGKAREKLVDAHEVQGELALPAPGP